MHRATHGAHLLALITLFFGTFVHAGKPSTTTATVSVSAPSPAVGTVTVTAKGTAKKLALLEVYVDGSLKATCTATPCNYPWHTPSSTNGTHTLVGKRYDVTGAVTTSAPLAVVVNNDVAVPTVSLTAPATAAGTVTLSASATDASGVTTTRIYLDGALVVSSAGAIATYSWNTTTATNGAHIVQAQATDPSGNVGVSRIASISVSNTPPPSQGGVAELPREYMDTTYVVPTGQTIAVPAGGDFQAALNAAEPGDLITLQAGATYTGPFTLPYKTGSGWITVRTSAPDASLPQAGDRVEPSYALFMPKIVGAGSPVIALQTAPAAHHFRFIAIEFLPQAGAFATSLIRLGTGSETSLTSLPSNIIFDRVYVHGDPIVGARRGIMLNSERTAVIDSYFADFKENGADSQAIAGWNGPGPFKIANNYLEAAGENLLFGGADPKIPNLVPSDIEVRDNHFAKPLSWRIGDPSYQGTPWTVKNLFELKNARRVLIEGNLFEYNWMMGQDGTAINLKSANQSGTAPWSVTEDVTFRANTIQHAAAGIKLSSGSTAQVVSRIVIKDNLWLDIDGPSWGGSGAWVMLLGPLDSIVLDHNTVIDQSGNILTLDGAATTEFTMANNIVKRAGYGIKGAGAGEGASTLATYAPGALVMNNVLATANPSIYPASNYFPASLDDVGFVDPSAGDYRLAPSSAYKSAATDGTDVGATIH